MIFTLRAGPLSRPLCFDLAVASDIVNDGTGTWGSVKAQYRR